MEFTWRFLLDKLFKISETHFLIYKMDSIINPISTHVRIHVTCTRAAWYMYWYILSA